MIRFKMPLCCPLQCIVKCLVEMDSIHAHIVMPWAQWNDISVLVRQLPVCRAKKNMVNMDMGITTRITAIHILYDD